MIDTHCHLNFPELENDVAGVLERAKEAEVDRYIVPGADRASSEVGVALARQHSEVYAAVGIHPTDPEAVGDREAVCALAETDHVVAIGEVGLDYFRLPSDLSLQQQAKDVQHERFHYFIGEAKRLGKPLIIHSRNCFTDIFSVLKQEAAQHPTVIHCFSGSLEEAQAWLDLGYYLSFTGMITYPKNEVLRTVVRQVPLERMFLETDAPFLAPQGYRGQVGEPRFVREVAACVAEVQGVSLEKVATITTQAAERFFAL